MLIYHWAENISQGKLWLFAWRHNALPQPMLTYHHIGPTRSYTDASACICSGNDFNTNRMDIIVNVLFNLAHRKTGLYCDIIPKKLTNMKHNFDYLFTIWISQSEYHPCSWMQMKYFLINGNLIVFKIYIDANSPSKCRCISSALPWSPLCLRMS